MIFIKSNMQDAPQRSLSRKVTKQASQKGTKILPDNEHDEKVINTIQLQDNAVCVQFYANNLKIAIQTTGALYGMDVFTHAIQFKI
jgi:hypothetical protein